MHRENAGTTKTLDAPAPISDARLVHECLAGSEDCWREFVNRFRKPIWQVAYRFTAGGDDAEELVQDIYMRLLTALPQYRPSGALGGWVRQVATHVGIDSWRRRKRIPIPVEGIEVPELPGPAPERPDRVAERHDRAAVVRRMVEELPEELAEPVMLRDLMEMGYPEIAARLDIPVGTVKSRIHRGRIQLAASLKKLREENLL